MLLVNVDDMIKITGSNIKHENTDNNDNECIFFDTDKFLMGLGTMGKTVVTAEMLADIFSNSFTTGHIDYSRD